MKKLFQKNIQTSFFLLLFMMVSGFLFFGGTANVLAAEKCVINPNATYLTNADQQKFLAIQSKQECTVDFLNYLKTAYPEKNFALNWIDDSILTDSNTTIGQKLSDDYKQAANTVSTADGSCWSPKSPLSSVFTCLLLAVLKFFGWLLSISAAIFAWAADANSLRNVINGDSIYESWKIVRDLLNIAFILVLLYTAFTIIFQVDSSNKKIILTVVLMALLVNFSFPITRFIIDVGNSLMYTIFKSLLPVADSDLSSIFANIAEKSAIGQIVESGSNASVAQLISAIVFVAILSITFLMMSMLFVIRIVALAIIIIFSPVAFVGVIVPSISSKIDWWGNLFKYTFFGPAMAFMIFIATKVMNATAITMEQNTAFGAIGKDELGAIASMSKFAVPVVILWIGMGIAQKMGIEGAAMAQKFATKAVTWLPKAIAHSTGIPGGLKMAKDHYVKKGAPGFLGKIPGLRGEDKTQETEAKIGGLLTKGPRGWSSAHESIQRKRIAAKQKEFEDERLSESSAKAKLKSIDSVEKKAAALYLSKKDKINDSATFADAMKALSGDAELQNELRGKAKKDNDIKFVLDYDLANGIEVEEKDEKTGEKIKRKITDREEIYEKTLDMSSDDLAKQKSLHDSIGKDEDLQKYIKNIGKKEKGIQYLNKLFEKLTPSQRKIYVDNKLNTESNNQEQQRQDQPQRPHEEVQKENAQKNDERMKEHFDKNETS